MQNSVELNGRIWISTSDGIYLGEGRVTLLKKIDEFGSISSAASAMEMSYKKAWKLVKSMNAKTDAPLVLKKTGGVGGGGAELSEKGKSAIALYDKLKAEHKAFLAQKSQELSV